MWTGGAFDWVVVIVLYVGGIGFFHFLGGIRAAGEAFERWGRESSRRRRAKLERDWPALRR